MNPITIPWGCPASMDNSRQALFTSCLDHLLCPILFVGSDAVPDLIASSRKYVSKDGWVACAIKPCVITHNPFKALSVRKVFGFTKAASTDVYIYIIPVELWDNVIYRQLQQTPMTSDKWIADFAGQLNAYMQIQGFVEDYVDPPVISNEPVNVIPQ